MFGELFPSLPELPILVRFAILMTVLMTVPALCRKIQLPAVVGFIAIGVLSGPHGLQIGPKHNEVAEYASEIGKLLLMLFAGLEIDLDQFNRTRKRSIAFGVVTFAFPLAAGFAVGMIFGYGWIGALLIGSLLASHTLLGFPIVQRLGLIRNQAVTVTIGATILTDIASLLVLAVCLPIHTTGFSTSKFILQLVQLAIYVPLVLFGLSAVVRVLMARMKDSKEGQFLVILLSMAVAAIAAEAINLEGIIGAFLTGIALNRATHDSPAKTDLEFLGNTIAIPCFFLSVGFLIDLRVFAETTVTHFGLVASIVLALIVAKLAAALLVCKPFGYTRDEGFIMWSLSMPQVAATLAAALVAFNAKNADGQRLIDEPVLNSIIVLMVMTSVLGPVLTELFGKRLTAATGSPYDATPVKPNQNSTTTSLH